MASDESNRGGVTPVSPITPVFLEGGAGNDDPARLDEARRERAATALESALAFIERHGDGAILERARVALEAVEPQSELAAIAASQREDGSFDRAGRHPSLLEALGLVDLENQPPPVVGTLFGLMELGDLRALHTQPAERAEAFLRACQAADGSWGQPADDPSTRIFLTGMLGGVLGRTTCVRPEVLHQAGVFLGDLWSPERVEGGSAATLAAYAHFFTNVHHDLSDEALQWCGRELERGFHTRQTEALVVARVLLWCDAAALPGFGIGARDVLDRLLEEQGGDGGFAELAVGGPLARLNATLDSLRVIPSLCAAF